MVEVSWIVASVLALATGCFLRFNTHKSVYIGLPPSKSGRSRVPPKDRLVHQHVLSWCGAFLYFLVFVGVAWAGIFVCERGVDSAVDTNIAVEAGLISVSPANRGVWWSAAAVANKLFLSLPLFVVSHGGDRLSHYDALAARGDVTPFNGGVLLHSYSAVSDVVTSTNQPRGQYLGAMIVPDRCLGAETLIFQVRTPCGAATASPHSQHVPL